MQLGYGAAPGLSQPWRPPAVRHPLCGWVLVLAVCSGKVGVKEVGPPRVWCVSVARCEPMMESGRLEGVSNTPVSS